MILDFNFHIGQWAKFIDTDSEKLVKISGMFISDDEKYYIVVGPVENLDGEVHLISNAGLPEKWGTGIFHADELEPVLGKSHLGVIHG